MGFFNRKADPISERSQALKQEIAALEAQIRQLSAGEVPEARKSPPTVVSRPGNSPQTAPKPRVLKQIPAAEFKLEADPVLSPLDLAAERPGLLRRLFDEIRGKPTSNPKLVTFLAAGSIQGLRPLRYEKRIARNRLVGLCIILAFFIWGILAIMLRR